MKISVPIEKLFPTPPLFETSVAARDFLHLNIAEGAPCPVCEQNVKLYSRLLDSNKVRFLLSLTKLATPFNPWVHYSKCFFRGRDYPHVQHWNLALMDTAEGHASGLWAPTAAGRSFAANLCTVPKYVYIYAGRTLGFSVEQIDVQAALGNRFDYHALMQAKPEDPIWEGTSHG